MKRAATLFALLLTMFKAPADAQGFCVMDGWYEEYIQLLATARESVIDADDTDEVVVDKTLVLFSVQYKLEALMFHAPDCAADLIRKSTKLVSLEANVGMFVVLQRGGLGLSDADAQRLLDQYTMTINATVESVQHAAEALDLFEAAY